VAESGEEKTLEPTAERLREAHLSGDFAISQEIITMVALLGGLAYFFFMRHDMDMTLRHCIRDFLSFNRRMDVNPSTFGPILLEALRYAARLAGPLLLLVMILGVSATIAQTGGLRFASKKEMFRPQALSPAAGVKKLFSLTKAFDGLKALLKVILFGGVCYWTVRREMDQVLILGAMAPAQALEMTFYIVMLIVFRACLLMILFAIIDLAFQRWQYMKKLRMTHQDRKEEYKKLEGNPENRRRQRSRQMEMSRNRMIASVRQADVVVTNPTHYAVALSYAAAKAPVCVTRKSMSSISSIKSITGSGAPRLLAKGARLLAERIKAEARRHDVPIVENRLVARSLYFACELNQEIPSSLYRAVAEILAYVYRVKGKTPAQTTTGRNPRRRGSALPGIASQPRQPLHGKPQLA
jgi:flagellar biosynthetic protein FlhB